MIVTRLRAGHFSVTKEHLQLSGRGEGGGGGEKWEIVDVVADRYRSECHEIFSFND